MINTSLELDASAMAAAAEDNSDPLNDSLWTTHQQKLPKIMSKIPKISTPRQSFRSFRNSNIFMKKHQIDNEGGGGVPSFLLSNRDSVLTSSES